MSLIANILIFLVAALHFWFLILEMFLWQKPIGLKTFKNTPESAKATAILAANQGLYNGFLAMGLLIGFFFSDNNLSYYFQTFFLSCVILAGLYGAWTVGRKILYVQALPAVIALIAVFINRLAS